MGEDLGSHHQTCLCAGAASRKICDDLSILAGKDGADSGSWLASNRLWDCISPSKVA
jgi:hypothetical protein